MQASRTAPPRCFWACILLGLELITTRRLNISAMVRTNLPCSRASDQSQINITLDHNDGRQAKAIQ